ncbi:WYL domain-containing protein [Colwellia sp. 6_MG-2023]|uniref:WYL domain-containing protein n=1 Tax=Colwellia sp. 6_MG-2023 TaxID=3062676 RepID=UPI0026E1B01B|nr:WYL domain-containing protein [Colwellia sp. 6_MG-2023]MDO6488432.1 WYL domain-containing protein [Colwellia sp. 6_MG-2023]
MPQKAMDSLTHAQKERLAFIDFNLQYFGHVSRADLISRFKTGLAACTRDLSTYRELASKNLILSHQTKNYHRTKNFQPIFEHDPEAILTALCRGLGDGLSNEIQATEYCQDSTKLVLPKSEIISAVMRAIHNQQAISCDYISLSSGLNHREIVPHTLVNNGQRWHVRAFDRSSQQFRDFVCTRLLNVNVIEKTIEKSIENPIATAQNKAADKQWNTIHSITLVPHPSIKYFEAIELDYAMVGGKKELQVREALLGYLMRQWNVDCSLHNTLVGAEYQLKLDNINELQGIDSMSIAPGYSIFKG